MKCLRQVNFIEKGGLFSSQVGLGTQGYDASISQALVRTPWWAASQWQVPVEEIMFLRSQQASGFRLTANDLPHRELRVPQEWAALTGPSESSLKKEKT